MTKKTVITQAEISRIIRAVQGEGWTDPEIRFDYRPDGSMSVSVKCGSQPGETTEAAELDRELNEHRKRHGYD